MGTITELGILLADLVEDQAEWSRATFGDDLERSPIGPLDHLRKEANEAKIEWCIVRGGAKFFNDDGNTPELKQFRDELADCLLLLLDASRRGGCKIMQLLEAAKEKMKKNKARTWPKVDDMNSAVEHVKDANNP